MEMQERKMLAYHIRDEEFLQQGYWKFGHNRLKKSGFSRLKKFR